MIIRVFGHSGETRFPFEKAGPWVYFKSRLEELGHEIAEEGKSPADAIIANFHSPRVLRYAKANKIPQHRRTLILWEPWIVEKTRYEDKVLKQYGKVLCPSIIWAQRVNGEAFFWPQDRMKPIEDFYSWKKRKNKLIVMQSNKFSSRKGERYSLRRKVLMQMTTSQVDLFGHDWNRGYLYDKKKWLKSLMNSRLSEISFESLKGMGRSYPIYRGSAPDKSCLLQDYKMALVIENSIDFVSEKLFDSVNAGCATIYVGPDLSIFGITPIPFLNTPPDTASICKAISSLTQLSDNDCFKLAGIQRKSLSRVWSEWENTKVLRDLADKAISKYS